MKKTIIVLLALILALPALSYAGSVTSRWDMVIGGYVKFDVGYGDQSLGVDHGFAPRSSLHGNQNVQDEYSGWYWAGGETRLNMLIKGPDGWGAKTSAFIEGEFRGNSGAGYGLFNMRHAFMKMDWPNATLTLGHTWQRWGFIPSFAAVGAVMGWNDLGPFNKGTRQPRIDLEYRFGPGFSAAFAVMSQSNTLYAGGTAVNGGVVDNGSVSDTPWMEGEFKYTTAKCGKIGPYGLMAALGAVYGTQKNTYMVNTNATSPIRYSSDNNKVWAVALKGFIPIIPEKNKNKAGALAIGGNIFYGQNVTNWFAVGAPAPMVNYLAYNAGTATNQDWKSPITYGGWGQVTYFFTDKLFVNGYYGYMRNNFSNQWAAAAANINKVKNHTEFILNVAYDINQAMRVGLQYEYGKTTYANYQPTTIGGVANGYYLAKDGSYNTVRIGAYYFF